MIYNEKVDNVRKFVISEIETIEALLTSYEANRNVPSMYDYAVEQLDVIKIKLAKLRKELE
jgi:hypothetical protein